MKKVIVDLKNIALTAIAGAFTMIGSVISIPGRLLSWIGDEFADVGGCIAEYVIGDDKKD